MPYTTFTSRIIPYDIDGTVVKVISGSTGVIKTLTANELAEINDIDFTLVSWTKGEYYIMMFFAELKDIEAIYGVLQSYNGSTYYIADAIANLQGSADSTNGLDGTWVNATVAAYPSTTMEFDSWRKGWKGVSGLNGVKVIRFKCTTYPTALSGIYALHLYGHKTSGETADDILFLDAENSDAEYTIPQDFGDRPAGTSETHDFKVKNASTTKAANNLVLTVTDADDIVRISEDGVNWVTQITIASLAANTASATMYIKCETPTPPTPLGPKRACISTSVGSWT